jgi:alcohol dehydrogenase (cytochrome c)
VVIAGKDGFVRSVDRKTHALFFQTPDTTIFNADKKPTVEGIRVCPGILGGVEWNGPAFDPTNRTLYIGSVDWCGTIKSGEAHYVAGEMYFGTAYSGDPVEKATGWVTALDSKTGAVRWQFHAPKPVVAGITPTSGGLVFTGDMAGNVYAFDKSTGEVLLSLKVGGAVAGGVITYTVAGQQYVATTAGNVSRTTWGEFGSPTMIVMAVAPEQSGEPTKVALPEVTSAGLVAEQPGSEAATGQERFREFCSACHGFRGEGAGGPSLTGAAAPKDIDAIIAIVKNPNPPMPKLYPTLLDDEKVIAIARYVQDLQRTGAQ